MGTEDFTILLRDASAGSESAADRLLPLVYDELRRLAQHYLAQERPDHTLQATALVHEAYLKLVDQSRAEWSDRAHFLAVAAGAIRRILVDHARGKRRQKRGGDAARAEFRDVECGTGIAARPPMHADAASQLDLVALDEALDSLAQLNERQARIVEMRFFAGLSIDEIAKLLNTSARTVDGDWAMARLWLKRQITGHQEF